MKLADKILYQRIDEMPQPPEHSTVWHLCHKSRHMQCAAKVGMLAVVSQEVPEVPDENQAGWFLTRLHPLSRSLQMLENGKLGV